MVVVNFISLLNISIYYIYFNFLTNLFIQGNISSLPFFSFNNFIQALFNTLIFSLIFDLLAAFLILLSFSLNFISSLFN